MSYAPDVTWEVFWPGLVAFAIYLFAGVPLVTWLIYRHYRAAFTANQTTMRRVILLRCCAFIAFTSVLFMIIAIKVRIGSHVDDPNFATLPQSAQSLIPMLVPFVIALGIFAACSFGITFWIEWREERAGRWPIRRQHAEDSSATTNV